MMRSFTPMNGKKVACLIHCTCIPTKHICIHLIQKAHSPQRNFNSISLLFFAKLFSNAQCNSKIEGNYTNLLCTKLQSVIKLALDIVSSFKHYVI